ncbi:MAG: hypothetical protein AB1540_01870 [Bdellovibrionota bacterium]
MSRLTLGFLVFVLTMSAGCSKSSGPQGSGTKAEPPPQKQDLSAVDELAPVDEAAGDEAPKNDDNDDVSGRQRFQAELNLNVSCMVPLDPSICQKVTKTLAQNFERIRDSIRKEISEVHVSTSFADLEASRFGTVEIPYDAGVDEIIDFLAFGFARTSHELLVDQMIRNSFELEAKQAEERKRKIKEIKDKLGYEVLHDSSGLMDLQMLDAALDVLLEVANDSGVKNKYIDEIYLFNPTIRAVAQAVVRNDDEMSRVFIPASVNYYQMRSILKGLPNLDDPETIKKKNLINRCKNVGNKLKRKVRVFDDSGLTDKEIDAALNKLEALAPHADKIPRSFRYISVAKSFEDVGWYSGVGEDPLKSGGSSSVNAVVVIDGRASSEEILRHLQGQ